MKLNVEEMLRVIAQFEARVAKDFGLKEGPLTGACVHDYVQHKEFGGTKPAGKPVCKNCGKVRE